MHDLVKGLSCFEVMSAAAKSAAEFMQIIFAKRSRDEVGRVIAELEIELERFKFYFKIDTDASKKALLNAAKQTCLDGDSHVD